jgi:hypothetical protein
MMANIRQADFDAPIGCLVMRDGRELPISRYDLGAYELAQEIAADPNNLLLTRQFLRRILKTASEADLESLNEPVVTELSQRARLGIAEAEALLGESSGARTTANATTGSPPEPPADTSVTASLARTG